jgi:CO/xanthine dehydrogenase FAD-binding subunit
MKPAPFEYVRATSVDEAVAALAAHGGNAKVLAGGQSLVPMLNFRLVDTPVFVDINRIEALSGIGETADGGLRIGALTRHRVLETSETVRARFPVIHAAMKHVAHLAIRNRGTIGGSLSHADPAAELPAMAVLLDATIRTASPSGGRAIPAREFFLAPLTTALADDELVVAVELPGLPPDAGWGFEEFAQRHGDFAIAGAAAVLALDGGRCSTVRLALMGVHDTPFRAEAAEKILAGRAPDEVAIAEAARAVRDAVAPMNDLHASEDFRRHLAEAMTRRALRAAAKRAGA